MTIASDRERYALMAATLDIRTRRSLLQLSEEQDRFTERFGAALDNVLQVRDGAKAFYDQLRAVKPNGANHRRSRKRAITPKTVNQRVSLSPQIVGEREKIAQGI